MESSGRLSLFLGLQLVPLPRRRCCTRLLAARDQYAPLPPSAGAAMHAATPPWFWLLVSCPRALYFFFLVFFHFIPSVFIFLFSISIMYHPFGRKISRYYSDVICVNRQWVTVPVARRFICLILAGFRTRYSGRYFHEYFTFRVMWKF